MRKEIEDKIKFSPEDQVDLGGMKIQDSEIEEIALFIIRIKPQLHEIYLNNNLIGDEGGVILGKELSALTKLSRIDLQFNNLDKKGITSLVSLQLKNANLELSLHGNKLTNMAEMEQIKNTVFEKKNRYGI